MLFALLSLLPALVSPAQAAPCVAFDASWNLYAFGGTNDVGLGAASSWGGEYSVLCTMIVIHPVTTVDRDRGM
jgi:hypothetical protein